MKKFLILLAVSANILILFIPGCIPSKPTDDIEILPSERLINRLEANRRKIRNFEGQGTITIRSAAINNSASFRVVLQKPDSIYLTIMGPFGIELAQALVTRNEFLFYDALQNTAYQGFADDNILEEIFKINLSFSDLMDAFIGSVNLTEKLYKTPNKYEVDYDQYILTYIDSVKNSTTQYKVDIRQLGITGYRLTDPKGVVLEGKYSNFKILESVAVPHSINIRNQKENQTVTIEYKNLAANQSNIFIDLKIPSDAVHIKW